MKLEQALAIGRPLKRSGWREYATYDRRHKRLWLCNSIKLLDVDDALADDWEVQESKVTITEREFWETYAEAVKEVGLFGRGADISRLADKLFGGYK